MSPGALTSPATSGKVDDQCCSQPCLPSPREWEPQGSCVGTAAGRINSSALQHVLCIMQKSIWPVSLQVGWNCPLFSLWSPVCDSRSPVTKEKCLIVLFVYSLITRAASLSPTRRKALFWCKPVMSESRELLKKKKKLLVTVQTHMTEREKIKHPPKKGDAHYSHVCKKGIKLSSDKL